MLVIIMAGGKGTRIASVANDIPKPMIPICGVPVLEREIECLKSQGYTDIILTLSHMAEMIMDYFGDGSKFGVNIRYYNEKEPLGNAGALFRLKEELAESGSEDFLLLNADSIFDINFNRIVKFHRDKNADVTLFTHPNSHPFDSGLVITNSDCQVEKWLTKEDDRPLYYQNRVNAGLHVINARILDEFLDSLSIEQKCVVNDAGVLGDKEAVVPAGKIDLDRMILKPLAGTGRMYAYDSPEYVKDMGTPERYHSVCSDYEAGIVKAKNLGNKQKAIFLDRDGTINKYVGFLRDISDFELLPGATEAIKKINSSGYLAIVVTNQPVIARGEVTFEELQDIHNKMETLLGNEGAYLDGIYFCPHHPHKGYDGEIKELKIECECRKPKPGLMLQAAKEFNIDLSKSWMIGDSENDILAGKKAGCMTGYICEDEAGLILENEAIAPEMVGISLDEIVKQIFRCKS